MFSWAELLRDGPAVMGVVNVTPDSFSDGGRYLDPDSATAHGLALAGGGATIIDVGGESTRPGAEPVAPAEERRRVVPVVEALAAHTGFVVSIDTTKATVAAAAIDAGASIVNDVSAGQLDPEIHSVVADRGAGYVAMHMQGEPRTMQAAPHYDDVVAEVGAFLGERLRAARTAGIAQESLAADPGIGFGKTVAHNLTLLARLHTLVHDLGVPVLIGTSRKSFIGKVLGADDVRARGAEDRDAEVSFREVGTLATVVWALDQGAEIVRVHDARAAVEAAAVLHAVRRTRNATTDAA